MKTKKMLAFRSRSRLGKPPMSSVFGMREGKADQNGADATHDGRRRSRKETNDETESSEGHML